MQKFLERMIDEDKELDGRINRLKNAVKEPPYGCDGNSLRMLAEQLKAMESYQYWLRERIKYEEQKRGN